MKDQTIKTANVEGKVCAEYTSNGTTCYMVLTTKGKLVHILASDVESFPGETKVPKSDKTA